MKKRMGALLLTNLSAAYGDEEPEYTLNMLKEPNPDYKP